HCRRPRTLVWSARVSLVSVVIAVGVYVCAVALLLKFADVRPHLITTHVLLTVLLPCLFVGLAAIWGVPALVRIARGRDLLRADAVHGHRSAGIDATLRARLAAPSLTVPVE